MANDIFGRRPLEFGGAFAADSARIDLSFGCIQGQDDPGLLIQQLGIQYQQPITRLFSVGSQKTYFVAGRPQGSVTAARVLGPDLLTATFYQCIGDVCQAATNDLCFCLQPDCSSNENSFAGLQISIKNVVLQSLGFSVQAQDMIINEQMSIFFTAMLVDTGLCPTLADSTVQGCAFE